MTREEQILKAGEEIVSNPFELEGFIEGAEWADEHPQKKLKWTEEDEGMLYSVFVDIEYARLKYGGLDTHYEQEINWLKSLKQKLEE